jgi:Zn-dependent metalloprotease
MKTPRGKLIRSCSRWGCLIALLWPALAMAQSPQAKATAEHVATFQAELGQQTGGVVRIEKRAGGHVGYLALTPGKGAKVKSAAAGSSAEAIAHAFMKENAPAFHDSGSLVEYATHRIRKSGTRTHVKLDQMYQGVQVYGGQANVQVEQGAVSAVQATLMEGAPGNKFLTVPLYSLEQARETALLETERAPGELTVTTPTLRVYEPALLQKQGGVRLVWLMEVKAGGGAPLRDEVLIDAHTGKTALRFTKIEHAKNRVIYDANNTSADPGTLRRSEGGAAYGLADVDLAYQYFGDTYDFYLTNHSRDSIDGAGLTMSATVRYCDPAEACPYENAYWDGARMYFGQNFASADDVIGHELTHGVTENESALIYQDQSGAINESLSDMWGEWIDQSNGAGTDTAGVKWQMGEDLPASIGVIRNMQDPTIYNDPDRMGSPNYYTGTDDNGGVHFNSGVGNKLCYLLTDGGTFNGHTVTGLGIAKAADLMYETQVSQLTSSSNYYALYTGLTQAAINLGFSVAEKASVEQACQAVEITTAPVGSTPPSNDECSGAITLSSGVAFTSTSLGATGVITSSCSDASDFTDVWFKFTSANAGTATISTSGSVIDTVISVYATCGGAELGCNDDESYPSITTSKLSLAVTAGATYYIRLAGWSSETGAYTILVTAPSGGGGGGGSLSNVCINELLIDSNSATYNFDTDGNGTADTPDDFIEIYNSGATTVDISGWKLWSNATLRYTFPASTVLGAGGFAVVIGSVQSGGTLPGVNAGSYAFSAALGTLGILSNTSGNVVLLDTTNNQYIQCTYNGVASDTPTSYSGFPAGATIVGSVVAFGNDQDGMSLGRYPDGSSNFVRYGVASSYAVLATPGYSSASLPVELSTFAVE